MAAELQVDQHLLHTLLEDYVREHLNELSDSSWDLIDYDGSIDIETAWRNGLKPDPNLLVSEWSDSYRILAAKASNEAGKWRTSRTPYLKEIMDSLSPSYSTERVVFMKGAQIGATEAGNCFIGYVIHQAPGPMLAVSPTVEMAKRNSRQRIDPLISDCPELKERVLPARSRDSGNTIFSKDFPRRNFNSYRR